MRKPKTIAFWIGRLPHWEVEEGRYFVTIHLAGAIPQAGQQRIRKIAASLKQLSKGREDERIRIQRRIFSEMERWLDTTTQAAHLQVPAVADIVVEAITHRQDAGVWHLFEYVVMPNHIHLFFELLRRGLKKTLEDFKRWTARRVAEAIGMKGDEFWQEEWFDHWSRSDEEDDRIAAYIRPNPEKAELVKQYQDWPYGSW